jgi:hypothetical protein
MSEFYQAIVRNNHSVALLASGQYDAAIAGQTHALSIIKRFMDTHGDDLPLGSDGDSQQPTDNGTVTVSLDQCMARSAAASSSSSSKMAIDTDERKGGEFLYEQGIIIPTNVNLDQDMGAMVSCMIIFNFALACQLCAMHAAATVQGMLDEDDEVRTNLNKAIKLYQLSFNLQRNARMDGNVLFSLAVVNNLGLAHRLLHNQEDSGKCFEYVLSTLMFLTDCGECGGNVFEQHLDGFFFNVTSLISTPSTAPAA